MLEIIHVADPRTRFDAERPDLDMPMPSLAPGLYVVLTRAGTRASRVGSKRLFGPFSTLAHARLLLKSAEALGLARSTLKSQPGAGVGLVTHPALAANESLAESARHARETACAAC